MLRVCAADLHIHTALSSCAEEEMTPPAIVESAVAANLGLIAICDHNSAGNVLAVQEAAASAPLAIVPAIEITTSEEVHVLGFFPDGDAALIASREVRETLPKSDATDRLISRQSLLDASGESLGVETAILSTASGFSLKGAVEMIHSLGGLAVASHVDRPSFSVTSQLGFVPDDVSFDALEISHLSHNDWQEKFPSLRNTNLPILFSSDSHFLSDIGSSRTLLTLKEPTFEEFRLCLLRAEGRDVHHA